MIIDGGLRKLFQRHLPAVHWQAIETGGTGLGVPDLNGCDRGVEYWIECKRVHGWKVTVRPQQVAWIERRARCGGRVFIAARKSTMLWLLPAPAARLLANGCRINAVPVTLGHWQGGPQGWDWAAIGKILRGS